MRRVLSLQRSIVLMKFINLNGNTAIQFPKLRRWRYQLLRQLVNQTSFMNVLALPHVCKQLSMYAFFLFRRESDTVVGDARNANWNHRHWTTDPNIADK